MDTLITPHMGHTLTVLLAKQGLSHTEIAVKLKMHRQQIGHLCATAKWHTRTIWRVAKALKVPVETFLSPNGSGRSA